MKQLVEQTKLDQENRKRLFKERVLSDLETIPKNEDKNGRLTVDTIKDINNSLAEYSLPDLRVLFEDGRAGILKQFYLI